MGAEETKGRIFLSPEEEYGAFLKAPDRVTLWKTVQLKCNFGWRKSANPLESLKVP